MSKVKLSVSISVKTLTAIEEAIAKGIFRNKSHALEYAFLNLSKNGR